MIIVYKIENIVSNIIVETLNVKKNLYEHCGEDTGKYFYSIL